FEGMKAIVMILAFALAACLNGSGRVETRSFPLADFDSVETDMFVQLDVTRSDAYAVSVTADDNVWSHVQVTKTDRKLKIELRQDTFYTNVTMQARVSMPALVALHVSGGSRARLTGFDVRQPSLDIDASGSSGVVLFGEATTANVHGSGASDLDLSDLQMEYLDYDLSGASHIHYAGSPKIGRAHAD